MNKKLIIILGVLGSSFSAIFVRFAHAPAIVMAFFRMCIAAVIMLPIVLVKNRQELFSLAKKDLLLSMLSGVFLGLHFTTYFLSLDYTSIASSTTLACTEVFFVAFSLVFFFKETVSKQAWLGIIVAFAGSVIIALSDLGSGKDMFKGDLIALLAGLLMAFYTIIGKVVRKNVTTNTYTFIVYTMAAITVACAAAVTKTELFAVNGRILLCAAGTAIVCTLLGHSIFSWGLKYVQASYVSNAKMLSPVYATIFGVILFREIPDILGIVGCITVIAGVIIYSNNLKTN
ncbi:MAG: DMT family transporter [Eubacteriales bacterium]|nr:DMT family transporter [Eubacteriales bacterium]